ncbi:MAG: 23S rRNA (pseudouridine(1915)-N(3))-methyltransferase RlmH [Rhodospirillaceae bacterium]|nr:23S rRNA (pseudouridine(1915)-N(3))-methyltransferase RlmH [Rhodospirillaceae bacterium]
MRLTLHAVGRARRDPLAAVVADYAKRLAGGPLSPLAVREVEVSRAATALLRKQAEAEALLAGVAEGAVLVALDERGRDLASVELAERLGAWRDDGVREAAFVIGGPDGLAPGVTARADLVLAFGRATWPHLMVRAMLTEQLYRAACILAGHPYHRA